MTGVDGFSMKKIFVYGGCVSRDVFNPEFNKGGVELVNYVARNSIVKIKDKPIKLNIDSEKVSSQFQRRLLINDSENNLLNLIGKDDFDIFFMDLLFLRYRVVSYKGTWLTYSNELKKSGVLGSLGKVINYDNDLFWDKFKVGIDFLFDFLANKDLLNRVLINRLYLSSCTDKGEFFDNQEYINRFNSVLDRAYDYLVTHLEERNFLNYNRDLFVADSEHRWGVDPMHYVSKFYEESYRKLASF